MPRRKSTSGVRPHDGMGADGTLAQAAGHDINYVALNGVLGSIGRQGEVPPPILNLLGDFGGGGMMLAFGVVSAVLEARTSGRGQVVDAAMADGSALLMSMIYGMRSAGDWSERGTNLLDGGAPFFEVMRPRIRKYVTLGSMEPQFWAEVVERLELDEDPGTQYDPQRWPQLKLDVAAKIATRTRDEWTEILGAADTCYAPVLTMEEAPLHPHMVSREAFTSVDGFVQPSPAPRFSRTAAAIQGSPPRAGEHTDDVLREHGFSENQLSDLKASGGAAQSSAS